MEQNLFINQINENVINLWTLAEHPDSPPSSRPKGVATPSFSFHHSNTLHFNSLLFTLLYFTSRDKRKIMKDIYTSILLHKTKTIFAVCDTVRL